MPPEGDNAVEIAASNGNFDLEAKEEIMWKSFAPKDLGARASYNLGISAVVPRPVAVITSIFNAEVSSESESSSDGDNDKENGQKKNGRKKARRAVNCAPFSYTGLLSHDPPMVAHGICLNQEKDGSRSKKDTLVNIEQSKEWVFNVLSESYLQQANSCSEALPHGVSEVEKNDLSTLPSIICKTPRLAQAMVSMECVLDSTKEIYNDDGEHTTTVVMGKIVQYHIHSSVLKDKHSQSSPVVDLERLQSVGRAGDITYWPTGEGKAVAMERPKQPSTSR